MKRIGVFGIGNVLIGDDAVGPTVVTMLDALWEIPEGVYVEDLGTPSLDLAGRMAGLETVVFVDAVSSSGEPGSVRVYTRDEILRHPPGLRLSPHDPSLRETLLTVELLDDAPREVLLVGVVAKTTEGLGLSAEVEKALPAATAAVVRELERLGVTLTPRAEPRPVTPWWQAA